MTPGPSGSSTAIAGSRSAAIRLLGVVPEALAADCVRAAADGAHAITFRGVAAIVRPAATRNEQPTPEGLLEHHTVITRMASTATVLPAPALTTFRTAASVLHWLELHAVALTDGLAWVDGRCGARVTAERDLAGVTSDPHVLPPSAAAVESFRTLRRYVAATVPVSSDTAGDGTTIASQAFLVDRLAWDRFAAEVLAEDLRSPGLTLRLTGPWPLYDFVRLQF